MFDSTRKYWFNKDDGAYARRRKKQRFLRNQRAGLNFGEGMFELRKSSQILFITLNADERYRNDVGFRTMQRFRSTLFQRIRDAQAYERYRRSIGRALKDHEWNILHDIHGLIWRQEAGGENGDENHHIHLVVWVSVSRRDHVGACEELGLLWQRITQWGDFHNGNRYAHSYRNKWGIATGYIHRDDKEKREVLRKLIGLYMSKVTQTPVDSDEDDKLFGTRYFG
ncbi:hypothetical protein [Burkholderia cenocepacia]|uniref:hypothetical protein n=1 Tax=Burkholderia cenocepacia TaxID=95486 RepID=UPI001CF37BA5|nr:hypothetical protein [Burkholderia cenocepacia]MCA8008634.1 hypothetical protein [Burkholderia cenocepacia]